MVKRRRKVNEKVNPFKKLQKPGKHVKRIVIGAAGLVIIAGLAGDATYQIQEQEQAVLTTFGVPKAVAETGLHFKIPFIQKVQKVNTTIQGFPIGYSMGDNSVVENEGIMITSDYNFIDVDFFAATSCAARSESISPASLSRSFISTFTRAISLSSS